MLGNPELLFIIAVHLALLAAALGRIWSPHREKISKIFLVLWSVFAVIFPLVGPIFALAFVSIPGPDSNLNATDDKSEDA